ncbi:MAG: indole-3-glycerol phosphate synthase TrpC [Myxococcota bacterium]
MSILETILEHKRDEVRQLRATRSEAAWLRAAREAPPPRDFSGALEQGPPPRVIAEFKRASPSRGAICPEADPGRVARAYAESGAVALSVLTDRKFFSGDLDDLRRARESAELPVLRKDFILDPIQVLEARGAGADAVLLIVAALDRARLAELLATSGELGLAALVEVHTREELEAAREAGARIVGINNRDLGSFEVDVALSRRLAPLAAGCCVVSESGLRDAATLRDLAGCGVDAFLVGGALMEAADPGRALRELRGEGSCR